jgi:CRISPR system Cascade subunit CasD
VRLPDGPPLGPGLREERLEEALASYPFVSGGERPERVRMVIDAPAGSTAEFRCDVPISFETREFTIRNVETRWIETPPGV